MINNKRHKGKHAKDAKNGLSLSTIFARYQNLLIKYTLCVRLKY